MELEFDQFFLLMFCRGYVESILNLGQLSEARFCQDFEDEVQASFAAGVWPVFFADVL